MTHRNGHINPDGSLKLTLAQRFWSKVDRRAPDECWPWLASRSPKGYGRICVNGYPRQAHRVAWELTYGPVPPGKFICHHCDSPSCCNPAHGWPGTHQDNVKDMIEKRRQHHGTYRVDRKTGRHVSPADRLKA